MHAPKWSIALHTRAHVHVARTRTRTHALARLHGRMFLVVRYHHGSLLQLLTSISMLWGMLGFPRLGLGVLSQFGGLASNPLPVVAACRYAGDGQHARRFPYTRLGVSTDYFLRPIEWASHAHCKRFRRHRTTKALRGNCRIGNCLVSN